MGRSARPTRPCADASAGHARTITRTRTAGRIIGGLPSWLIVSKRMLLVLVVIVAAAGGGAYAAIGSGGKSSSPALPGHVRSAKSVSFEGAEATPPKPAPATTLNDSLG